MTTQPNSAHSDSAQEGGGALSRRAVVVGGCAAAIAVVGGYVAFARPDPQPESAPARSGAILGSTSDVPVGGGLILAAAQVVLTQPTAGVFRAFSAICTHQGCTVNAVLDGTINCPCHASRFDITDGAVVSGPARLPLPERPVTLDGTTITLT